TYSRLTAYRRPAGSSPSPSFGQTSATLATSSSSSRECPASSRRPAKRRTLTRMPGILPVPVVATGSVVTGSDGTGQQGEAGAAGLQLPRRKPNRAPKTDAGVTVVRTAIPTYHFGPVRNPRPTYDLRVAPTDDRRTDSGIEVKPVY